MLPFDVFKELMYISTPEGMEIKTIWNSGNEHHCRFVSLYDNEGMTLNVDMYSTGNILIMWFAGTFAAAKAPHLEDPKFCEKLKTRLLEIADEYYEGWRDPVW